MPPPFNERSAPAAATVSIAVSLSTAAFASSSELTLGASSSSANSTANSTSSSLQECAEAERPSASLEVHLISAMLLAFSVTGTAGNVLVLLVYSRARPGGGAGGGVGGGSGTAQQTSTVFILSLAIADLLACALNMPLTAAYELSTYHFGIVLCHLYHLLLSAIQLFSTHLMVAIAVDRYLCICHPFSRLLTVPRAKLLVLCIAFETFLESLVVSSSFEVRDKDVKNNPVADAPSTPFNAEISTISSYEYNTSSISFSSFSPVAGTEKDEEGASGRKQKPCVNRSVCTENEASIVPLHVLMKLHVSSFVLSVVIASVLYTLIYFSVLQQRAKKRRMKSGVLYKNASAQSNCTNLTNCTDRTQKHANGALLGASGVKNGAPSKTGPQLLEHLSPRNRGTPEAEGVDGSNGQYIAQDGSTSDSGTGAAAGDPISGSLNALQTVGSNSAIAVLQQNNGENQSNSNQKQKQKGNARSERQQSNGSKTKRSSLRAEELRSVTRASASLHQLCAPPTSRSASRDSAGLVSVSPRRRAAMSAEASARLQNLRIALMLFVVTITFVVLYTPGTLFNMEIIDQEKLTFSGVLYYTYFAMNVCNPLIYCFMNKNFRAECTTFFRCKGSIRIR